MPKHPPTHDDSGINLADPNDRRGLKSEYITLVQAMALERYIGRGKGSALDLGCGFGRMSAVLSDLGHRVVGMDPSVRVLNHARQIQPDIPFVAGKLPFLPFKPGTIDTIFALNVLRVLHLMGLLEAASTIGEYLAPGGKLVVLDNSRRGDGRYIPDDEIESMFRAQGLTLISRKAFRRSRWPLIYAIRYGFVPRRMFQRIAEFEIRSLRSRKRAPRFSYHNVLHVFERR